MSIPDTKYIKAQYKIAVLEKNGMAFQSFFEDFMLALYPDEFEKVKPYGREGDKKNDGFRKEKGIYYQVYAPEKPEDKFPDAIRKMTKDFKGLYDYWKDKFPIKEFYFVYNDKNLGQAPDFFAALKELRDEYPGITFDVLTPDKFKDDVVSLPKEKLADIGFDVDSRNIVEYMNSRFEDVEVFLDRCSYDFAQESLNSLQPLVEQEDNPSVNLKYGLLGARLLSNLDDKSGAEEKYLSLSKQFPKDTQAFLYLAEHYLDKGDYEKNESYLKKAEDIAPDNWLLKIEKVVRALRKNDKIDLSAIDESSFPTDKRPKSIFYRVYAHFFMKDENPEKANEFIEKAISYNPDRFANYTTKINLLASSFHGRKFDDISPEECEELISEAKKYLKQFDEWKTTDLKYKIPLLMIQINPLFLTNQNKKGAEIAKEAFPLCLQVKFDADIERFLAKMLSFDMPNKDFDKLLDYLRPDGIQITDSLEKALIYQFLRREELLNKGKAFFESKNCKGALSFIEAIEKNDSKMALDYIGDDMFFMIEMTGALNRYLDILQAILKAIPDRDDLNKDKLWVRYYYENGDVDKAFKIMKKLDLSKSTYFEYELFSQIAHDKQAWDLQIIILNQFLSLAKKPKKIAEIKLALFSASFNLKNYPDAIALGKELLEDKDAQSSMNEKNREILLEQTLFALLERREEKEAFKLLSKYHDLAHSFDFKADVEAEIHIRLKDADKALSAIVEGVCTLGHPTEEQYCRLFFPFVQIGNMKKELLENEPEISEGSFVKIKGTDRWYSIGDENELDTIKIDSSDGKFKLFVGKKIGEEIKFEADKYTSSKEPRVVESILSIGGYISWKSHNAFQSLCKSDPGKYGILIETPEDENGKVDLTNVLNFFKDKHEEESDFFDLYCSKNIPLAFLAVNQGGLLRAIGKICQENKGFIRFSSGLKDDDDKQKLIAEKILKGELTFLDATSALFLAEKGLLEKVLSHIPNLKIPQSVISFLFKTSEKFDLSDGNRGVISYAQGQIVARELDEGKTQTAHNNLRKSIELLESDKEAIVPLSPASKVDCLSETKVPAELVDACILAQRDTGVILTEDYLYLQANTLETKKDAPDHCSSLALIKLMVEKGLLPFDDFIDYFGYLSSYRCRFLTLSVDDLMEAVLPTEAGITVLKQKNIRKFNIELVLSEKYGIPTNTAILVMVNFLSRILRDNSITVEAADKIFIEIIPRFLNGRGTAKRMVGELLMRVCKEHMENLDKKEVVATLSQGRVGKFKRLAEQVAILSMDSLL
jgi:tetratricopeptide (TPR) repeat protein